MDLSARRFFPSALCHAQAGVSGPWTITFTGGTFSPQGSISSPNTTNPYVVNAYDDQSAGASAATGPTSIKCVYGGGTGGTAVLAAVVEVQPTITAYGSSANLSDGYGDPTTKVQVGKTSYTFQCTGTDYLAAQTGTPTNFTAQLKASSATAQPGDPADFGGDYSYANISYKVTVCAIGFSYGGTTALSSGPSIIIGQSFTATLVSQLPGSQYDTFTWLHPANGDASLPYTSYTIATSTSLPVYAGLTEPPKTSDSLTCLFGAESTNGGRTAVQNVECKYYSGAAQQTIDVNANTSTAEIAVYSPSFGKLDPGGWVSVGFGSMQLLPNIQTPGGFELWGAAADCGQGPQFNGIFDPVVLTDPPGFGGTGQFSYFQNITSDTDFWTGKQPPDPIGLDTAYPYPFLCVTQGPSSLWANSTAELMFTDGPWVGWSQPPFAGPFPTPFSATEGLSFDDYLAYVPPGGDTQNPVPLPFVQWTAAGTASGPASGNWTSSDSSTAPGGRPSNQFLQWANVVTGITAFAGGGYIGVSSAGMPESFAAKSNAAEPYTMTRSIKEISTTMLASIFALCALNPVALQPADLNWERDMLQSRLGSTLLKARMLELHVMPTKPEKPYYAAPGRIGFSPEDLKAVREQAAQNRRDLKEVLQMVAAGNLRQAKHVIPKDIAMTVMGRDGYLDNVLCDIDFRLGDDLGAYRAILMNVRDDVRFGGDPKYGSSLAMLACELNGQDFPGIRAAMDSTLRGVDPAMVKYYPADPSAKMTTALVCYRLGSQGSTVTDPNFYMQMTDKLEPDQPFFAFYVALMYEQKGEWNKAFNDLKMAIHKVPISAGRVHWFFWGLYNQAAKHLGKPQLPGVVMSGAVFTKPGPTNKYSGRTPPR